MTMRFELVGCDKAMRDAVCNLIPPRNSENMRVGRSLAFHHKARSDKSPWSRRITCRVVGERHDKSTGETVWTLRRAQ